MDENLTINTLEKLPDNLQPANLSTKIMDSAVLFHGKDSYLILLMLKTCISITFTMHHLN